MTTQDNQTCTITCTVQPSDKITFDYVNGVFCCYSSDSDYIVDLELNCSKDDAMTLSHDLQVFANYDEITLLDDKCEALERHNKHLLEQLEACKDLIQPLHKHLRHNIHLCRK